MTAEKIDTTAHFPSGHSVIESEVKPLIDALADIADRHAGDPEALLSLLRQLEQLHRSIQDGPFRSSLPSERSTLFRLLQDMELNGGWPYIPRLQLRTFLDLLQPSPSPDRGDSSEPNVAEAA